MVGVEHEFANPLPVKEKVGEKISISGVTLTGLRFLHSRSGRPEAMELLFLPSLPSVSSDPDFLDGSRQPAMQSIFSEFDPNDVVPEGFAIGDGVDLRPVLAGIG